MRDLERLLKAAAAHGRESDPDHEVGDLQDILRSAWRTMSPEQRKKVSAEYAQLPRDWL